MTAKKHKWAVDSWAFISDVNNKRVDVENGNSTLRKIDVPDCVQQYLLHGNDEGILTDFIFRVVSSI